MNEKEKLTETGKEIVEKKRRKGGYALDAENVLAEVEKGESSKYLSIGLRIMNLPTIDIRDYDAVQQRLGEYFAIYNEADTKPTVAGMANALGIDRQRLWSITHDAPWNGRGELPNIPKSVSDLIKKAYRILEEMMENYMQNGAINPVMGIFMAKNHFGYKDQTEYVVTPNVRQDTELDAEDIRKRYLTD